MSTCQECSKQFDRTKNTDIPNNPLCPECQRELDRWLTYDHQPCEPFFTDSLPWT